MQGRIFEDVCGVQQYRPTQQLNKAISYVSEMEMNEMNGRGCRGPCGRCRSGGALNPQVWRATTMPGGAGL